MFVAAGFFTLGIWSKLKVDCAFKPSVGLRVAADSQFEESRLALGSLS